VNRVDKIETPTSILLARVVREATEEPFSHSEKPYGAPESRNAGFHDADDGTIDTGLLIVQNNTIRPLRVRRVIG
jgi:hypothetical protein